MNGVERNPQLHALSGLLGNVSMVTVEAVTLWQESIVDRLPTGRDQRWRSASKIVLVYNYLRINTFGRILLLDLHKQENVLMSVFS